MAALREVAAAFGIEFDDTKLKNGMKSIDGAIGLVRQLGAAFAASAVVREAAAFVTAFAGMAHEARASAATLRVSTDDLQRNRNALELAGLSASEAASTFATFHRNVRGAALGGGEAAGAFARLGIHVRDGNRQIRGSGDVLGEVADRFMRIQDPARQARVAVQLFGDAGLQLLPALQGGAAGLAALRKETAALGGGTTPAAIEAARRYELALTRWRIVGDAARSQLAMGLIPIVTALVDKARQTSLLFVQLTQHTHGVRNALGAVGAVAAVAGAMMVAPFLPAILLFAGVAAGLTAVYLVFDDLVTLAEGGRSVIGPLLDEWFGAGTAAAVGHHIQLIMSLREAYEGVKLAWHDMWRAISDATGLGFASVTGGPDSRENESASRTRASFMRTSAERRQRAEAAAAEADTARNVRAGSALARANVASGSITETGFTPRAVTMASPARTTVTHHTDRRTIAPQFHISGTDPNRVAEIAVRRMRELMSNEMDATHTQQPRDD